MDDKSLGYGIVGVTLIAMVVYFVWFFAAALGPALSWLAPFADLAYKLPILIAVFLLLFIVLWIGYTMATTPPPIPLDNPLELEEEEKEKKE
jgi:membrane protein implicated in regulation of membrane protease activity